MLVFELAGGKLTLLELLASTVCDGNVAEAHLFVSEVP